jgi:hypothetical protein
MARPSEAGSAAVLLFTQNQGGGWLRKRLRPRRKPDPGPPGVGSRCATCAQIPPPGCAPRLQRGSMVAWSSTAATTGFVRGHRAPATTNNRRAHRDNY